MFKAVNIGKLIYRAILIPLAACFVITGVTQLGILFTAEDTILPASVSGKIRTIEGSLTGKVLIKLEEGYKPDADILILVNGYEAASLSTQSIELTVMNNSLVEIDSRKVTYPLAVSIESCEENVTCEGDYAEMDGNIVRLSRIFVTKD